MCKVRQGQVGGRGAGSHAKDEDEDDAEKEAADMFDYVTYLALVDDPVSIGNRRVHLFYGGEIDPNEIRLSCF